MKTSELIGNPLAWAVAVANGNEPFFWANWDGEEFPETDDGPYRPDLEWSQGGPIIEREKIKLFPNMGGTWSAQIRHEGHHPLVAHKVLTGWTNKAGPTPLIAAMRCYVASKLGDEVEIPKELLGEQ